MNKTNHLISSNSHPSATANKAIHSLKIYVTLPLLWKVSSRSLSQWVPLNILAASPTMDYSVHYTSGHTSTLQANPVHPTIQALPTNHPSLINSKNTCYSDAQNPTAATTCNVSVGHQTKRWTHSTLLYFGTNSNLGESNTSLENLATSSDVAYISHNWLTEPQKLSRLTLNVVIFAGRGDFAKLFTRPITWGLFSQ